MTPAAKETLDQLRSQHLRSASIATPGGFRPPENPLASWFFRGVGIPDETLPQWEGKPMLPLLQIRIDELPYVPEQLAHLAMIVLFHNQDQHPFYLPHGEGWLIREYESLDGLVSLPGIDHPFRAFPIQWTRIDDDAPGWEDAWSLMDLSAVNKDDAAADSFFQDFNRYDQTKVGGYPAEVQHRVGLKDFVFQVGSEEKTGWMWADNGIGYFFRSPSGEWRWSCQFY